MAFVTILILLQISSINSFLLTNSSFTGTRVTSFEYQHLFQLILDGQTRITNLAQDLRTLRTNNDQEFKKIENQHKQELSGIKVDLELKLNATKVKLDASTIALQDQINKSKLLGLELEREKANSHQLQQELTKIKKEFQNTSLTFNDLHTSLANMETGKNDTRKTLIENRKAIASNQAMLVTFNTSLSRTMTKISSSDVAITQLQQKTGYQSSFTVYGAPLKKTGPKNDTLLFPYIVSNIGGHYNNNTGIFTCVYSGTYYFTFNLYKVPTIPHAYCKIRKNGVPEAYADSFPGVSNTGSYTEATASLILHLVKDDIVDAGGPCSATKTFAHLSSFSGFLLKAD